MVLGDRQDASVWITLAEPTVRSPSGIDPPVERQRQTAYALGAFHPITTIEGLFPWWISLNMEAHLFRHLGEQPRTLGYVYLPSLSSSD